MPRPSLPTTRGHVALRRWMRVHYGEGNRRDDERPAFPAMRRFMADLNAAREGVPDGPPRPLASPFAIYDWMDGSQNPTAPGAKWRPLIAALSGGAVPVESWDAALEQPTQTSAA